MKITADNIFVGATIKDNEGNNFLVIKVNAKTFYAAKDTKLSDYNSAFGNRVKGTTFKKFCEIHGYKSYKYDNTFDISEEEIAKREVVVQTNNVNVDVLGKAEKLVITNLIKYNKLKLLANIGVGNSIMRIIEMKDDDKFLLNVDSVYILYNRSLDVSYKVCNVLDWGNIITEIPWEKITTNN